MLLTKKPETLKPLKLKNIEAQYALNLYKKGCANSWFPEQESLAKDKQEYETSLSDMEKHYLKYMLGFFVTAESLVANNINHALYKHMNFSEERLFLIRQAYEEANHALTFLYIIDSLGLDRKEIIQMYQTVPEIANKKAFEERFTEQIMNQNIEELSSKELFRNLFGFYAIMEGLFFFSGFLIGLSFGRRQVLRGVSSLINYILRDETVHLAFGMQAMRGILKEEPNLVDNFFKEELITLMKEAVDLESKYAQVAMPEGILGMNSNYYIKYCKHIADRRLKTLGLGEVFKVKNPAPWLMTATDLPMLRSFFEASEEASYTLNV